MTTAGAPARPRPRRLPSCRHGEVRRNHDPLPREAVAEPAPRRVRPPRQEGADERDQSDRVCAAGPVREDREGDLVAPTARRPSRSSESTRRRRDWRRPRGTRERLAEAPAQEVRTSGQSQAAPCFYKRSSRFGDRARLRPDLARDGAAAPRARRSQRGPWSAICSWASRNGDRSRRAPRRRRSPAAMGGGGGPEPLVVDSIPAIRPRARERPSDVAPGCEDRDLVP